MHLKGVGTRMPELNARIVEPAVAKLDALRQLSNDTRAMLQGDNNKVSNMQPAEYFAYASKVIDDQTAVTGQITAEIEKALMARQGGIQQQLAVQGTLVVLLAAIGLWLMVATVRGIVLSLRKMERLAKALGQGDLTQSCASTRGDEVGDCMNALEAARLNWERMLHNLVEAIDGVSCTSAQIAAGSQDLNGRTQTAAHSLEGTTQSIRNLTGTVQQTADSALQADEQARAARDTAEQGEQVMSQVVANMDNISTSSRKIADIIGVIDGIAFQTNILALNAAVEAARAGDLGRGFAVVASEVRSLAQRSANSAREIKTLINDSLNKVEVGTQLVNDAGASMQAIMRSNQQVTQIISEISSATRDQSQGFAQVNQAIGQLDDMTTQNSAMVRESSTAADALHDQAERLRQLVAMFKFDDPGLAS
jgi:methyl-accepting chemotaxis protein